MKRIIITTIFTFFASQWLLAQVNSDLFVQESLAREAFYEENTIATYISGKEQVQLLDDGAILVAGTATEDFDFAGVNVSAVSEGSAYLKKYNAQGRQQWMIWFSTGMSRNKLLDVDADGNIYIAGIYGGEATVLDANGVETVLPKVEGVDMINPDYAYMVKFNMDGDLLWSKYFHTTKAADDWGDAPSAEPTAMALDEGKVALAVSFEGTLNVVDKTYDSYSWMFGFGRAWSAVLFSMDTEGNMVTELPLLARRDDTETIEEQKDEPSAVFIQSLSYSEEGMLYAVASLSGCIENTVDDVFYRTDRDDYFMVPQLHLFSFNEDLTGNWNKAYVMDKGHATMDVRDVLQVKSLGVSDNNLMVGGLLMDTIYVSPDKKQFIRSYDNKDGFVARFSKNDGGFVASVDIVTQNQEDDNMVFTYSEGHTYVSGALFNSISVGNKLAVCDNNVDIFFADINHETGRVFLASTGGKGNEFIQDLSINSHGQVATVGSFLSESFNDCSMWGGAYTSTSNEEGFQSDYFVNRFGFIPNDPPSASSLLDDHIVSVGDNFTYQIPENTFNDPDGDELSISASLDDGSDLPEWLIYDTDLQIFSGTPAAEDVALNRIRLKAEDKYGASVSLHFQVLVQSATGIEDLYMGALTCYPNPSRGIITFKKELAQVEVFNIVGQRVVVTDNCRTLDLRAYGLRNGNYLVRMTDNKGNTRTEKLLLQ